jgi:hypothetical protein
MAIASTLLRVFLGLWEVEHGMIGSAAFQAAF